nr:hypothetical protein [uncultured Sphingobacterium sp.]
MKNNDQNLAPIVKTVYEAPKIASQQLELEYGIASGSTIVQQGWKDSQIITEDVENYYW